MATTFLAPDPIQSTQFIPGGNTPANGGQLFFYTAGSSTKQTVYKDNAAAVAWTNPIVLDSGGNLPSGGEVWFSQGIAYKVVFAPSNDTDPPVSPYWTKDNLVGTNDISLTSTGEWTAGAIPSFIGANSFSLSGDSTSTYTIGRRIKATVTAGTVYGTVTNSAFSGGLTTVTLLMDSTNLDSGMSAVFYGILASVGPSVPMPRTGVLRLQDSTNPTKNVSFSASSVTASTTVNLDIQNTSGTLALTSEFAYSTVAGTGGRLLIPSFYIEGFQISNSASSDAMDITQGQCVDSNNSVNIITTSTVNRKTIAAFSVGASSGAKMNAASYSTNTWYAWYALCGSSGAVDFGFDTIFPPSVPTTTAAFPTFRYIGARKSGASQAWASFAQKGDYVYWQTTQAADYTVSNPSTSAATTVTLSNTPPLKVGAILRSNLIPTGNAASAAVTVSYYISSPDVSDVTPTTSNSQLIARWISTSIAFGSATETVVWTNANAQLRGRAADASGGNMGSITVAWGAIGWIDFRGKPY